ncbi:MAG: FtsX-like permease family protein [Betaproteobacteria bacterium]|nr:FtsX-like permease family protein [Betaproteobacteria bacterium]
MGNGVFRVAAILTHEPGVAVGFLSGAPRLMLNAADLDATGLVQPGSRVRYRLQLAGGAEAVDAYRAWAELRLNPGQRIEGIRDARPEIRSALERAERFVNLAALTSVLMAAVAIALAARRYLQRHLDGCAMMRCLGASQALIARLHLAHFAMLGLIAAGLGMLAGAAAQTVLAAWLGQVVVAVTLPPPGAAPALRGVAVGLLLLLGFALPPLLSLARVPTLRVLRREMGIPGAGGMLGYALGAAVIGAMILWGAREISLGLTVLGWFAAAVAGACALAWAVLRGLAALRSRGVSWRFGVASLRRRQLGTILQVAALGLGIMALLTLTVIRTGVLRAWQESLPPGAPNRFIINIQPGQVEPVKHFFMANGMVAPELHPMVRGRLVRIGERGVVADDYPDERAKRLIAREFNLSWAARLKADNRVVAGQWWGDTVSRRDQFSVERGGLLEAYPATYVTSFHLPRGQVAFLNALVRDFRNIVLIDVAQMLAQVQRMLEQAARAVQFVFLFTLLAGLVVLYAAIASTQDERLYQATIMRTLGASRAQINRAHLAEFAAIGAMAGFVAAAGATGLGWFLSSRFLHLDYAPDPAVWLIGIAGGALGIAAAGYLGTRRVLTTPPLGVLRRIG